MMRLLAFLLVLVLGLPAAAQVNYPAPGSTGVITAIGGQVQTAVATIANGQSLSGAIDLNYNRMVRIVIPAGGWTAANLTFQTSADCTTYGNLRDNLGNEYTVTVSTAGDEIIIPYADFVGVRCLKVRSGTSATPVAQGGARSLTIVALP